MDKASGALPKKLRTRKLTFMIQELTKNLFKCKNVKSEKNEFYF